MINILPLPIFSDKWHISMNRMPKIWSSIIEHTIIWTLSYEKRLRDCELELYVMNIPHEQIITIGQDIRLTDHLPEQSDRQSQLKLFSDPKQRYVIQRNTEYVDRKMLNTLGNIYICSDNIQKHMDTVTEQTFVYLIQLFIDATLALRNQKPSPGYKQKILSKFGLGLAAI